MAEKTYRQKAAILRSVGFKLSLGAKGGTQGDLSRKKSAVTRAWKRVGSFIESGTHKFVPASRRQRDAFAAKKAKAPGGFFQPVPAGVNPGKIRYKIQGSVLRQTVSDAAQGQRRTDYVIRLDARKVAAQGQSYIDDVIAQYTAGTPRSRLSFKLMVNGWDGKNPYDPKDIGKYLIEKFFPSLRSQKLKAREVNDIFHLKITVNGAPPRARELGDYDDDDDDDNDDEEGDGDDEGEGDPF